MQKIPKAENLKRQTSKKFTCQTVGLASWKSASNWLNVLPLTKVASRWTRRKLETAHTWDSELSSESYLNFAPCSYGFKIAHALLCPEGGYTHYRHNGIKDTIAEIMGVVCEYVEIESLLQLWQGESFDNNWAPREEEAGLDIKANGRWGHRFTRCFLEMKIFNS